MRAQSTELVYSLFAECSKVLDDQFGLCKTGSATAGIIFLLVFAAILGFLLASITFGLQIPAGIILPSMAVGALFGRAVGIVMEIWVNNYTDFFAFSSCEQDLPCVTPGTYAIIGAAAALGGVTRMTVSIVVIMFELTGALTYVLPIMIAVMVSKWVGDAFGKRGIYESWIHFNEYPFLDNSEETLIPDIPVSQIMTRIEDLVVLTATGHTIESLANILATQPYRGFPVISDPREAILLGYISRAELTYNLHTSTHPPRSLPPETEAFFSHQPLADPRTTLDLRPWMDQTPITLPSQSNLLLTANYFQKLGLRYVLFSDRGVLQGLLTKRREERTART
jgi:chloride channel 3/4/5